MNRRGLEGVIFDLDGTLGDTLPVCFTAFRRVFESYLDVTYDDESIRSMFGPTEEGILASRIPHDPKGAMDLYLREYEDAHDVAPAPFIGIRRLLGRLKDREIPMAIVTGKGPRSAALSLDHWGIADRFDAVEAGSAEGNIKDRNMRRVLGHWAADPGQVVAVGDAPTDVHAARAAGVVPVAAAWASTAHPGRLAAERPDHVFEAVARFSDWLLA